MAAIIKRRPPTTWAQVPPVLDSDYVAMLFGLSKKSVQALTRQGKIPGKKLGKEYRYEKGALMKFMGAVEEAQT